MVIVVSLMFVGLKNQVQKDVSFHELLQQSVFKEKQEFQVVSTAHHCMYRQLFNMM